MHTAALNPLRPIRNRRLYALVFLLALAAYATALFAMPQHAGVPQHPGLPRGEKHEGRREIDQMEEAWRKAVLTGDVAVMEGLLADDYIGINPNGILLSKDDTLARLHNPQKHITNIELSDSKVRFYGSTALVTSFAHVTGTNAEGEAIGDFRYTRVYIRNAQSQWKIVSFEASRIRLPGTHR
ncbi:MAG: nuclear transport factor 2 family protein [Terracidiphilus sp.]|jgi:ketosteroid isomerase-like protein